MAEESVGARPTRRRWVDLVHIKEIVRREVSAGNTAREVLLQLDDKISPAAFEAQVPLIERILSAAESANGRALADRAGLEHAAVELDALRRAAVGIERAAPEVAA